eukprot:Amastigsp_a345854_70.p4 type:complete len:113 gc:universal Amastigsp_a345854_70:202-540(+)
MATHIDLSLACDDSSALVTAFVGRCTKSTQMPMKWSLSMSCALPGWCGSWKPRVLSPPGLRMIASPPSWNLTYGVTSNTPPSTIIQRSVSLSCLETSARVKSILLVCASTWL